MAAVRRIPSWLLIVATGVMCVLLVALDATNVFPLWRFAVQWSPAALPSSRVIPPAEVMSGVPIMSLTLDDADLNDQATGLFPNKMKHGREWEREGSVSYFENGRLRFASGVGVRIHGGSSRIVAPRKGFRLYFRREYGPREVPPGVLFSAKAQPVRRLVIHDDVRRGSDRNPWHFVNPLAYDIARAMGAIAPETKPVRFYLNGEYYGPFVLTERFDERYFAAHWGHDDILLSQRAMDEFWEWVRRTRPLTMKNVAEHVNVESLTRWFLAVAFSATRDAYQGPGQFLDQSKPRGGWFWVNWDMDQSFRDWDLDSYQYLLERIGEARRGRNDAEPRARILTELLAGDAEYRLYFKRVVQKALNHQVTQSFLDGRYQHYLDTAATLRVERLDYLVHLREFLEKRRDFFRRTTEQWVNSLPSQPVTITAPKDVSLIIEDERVSNGYRGMYFPDLAMTVEVAEDDRAGFAGWRVNGRDVSTESELSFTARGPTQIEAVFNSALRVTGSAAEEPATLVAPHGPPPMWRNIPAGLSWMGCVPADERCGTPETPRVPTRINEPFEMMETEVSAGAFRAFAAATGTIVPRQPDWYADDKHPVVNVTWDEAQAYCAWAGGRLPTEPEWEHAARGGLDGRLFPWGDTFQGEANARHNHPAETYAFTTPIGMFPANPFGLHDMAGNVWEWTASEHRPKHDAEPSRNYDLRTIKGGSWDNTPRHLRVSEREALSRGGRHNLYVGFRCVRTVRQ